MTRLPRIADLDANAAGFGFFLCARKDRRPGRSGPYLALVLQDISGEMGAKIFTEVDALSAEFDVGDFVKVQGRGNAFQGRTELILEKIRRVNHNDTQLGFNQADCIPSSHRNVDEMWTELQQRIASVEQPQIRALLQRLAEQHADKLRVWPAAVQVHHAYRSGLLEHVLSIMDVVVFLGQHYQANLDLLVAGTFLHDLGKLEELSYTYTTDYTVPGNLVGHIAIGVGMLRDAAREIPDFPPDVLVQLEHLILSHHGEREHGSPVLPMTVEAFILASSDHLDATINQVRHLVAADDSTGPFTAYSKRLDRKLFKTSTS